jgi:hypothetical protein
MAWSANHDFTTRAIPITLNRDHETWLKEAKTQREHTKKAEQRAQGVPVPSAYMGLMDGYPFPIPDFAFGICVNTKPQTLPLFLPLGISYAIPQQVIDAIESVEPGVHQYWPAELTWDDGTPIGEKRWLLNICNRLDTLLPDVSEDIWVTKPPFGEGKYIFTDKMQTRMGLRFNKGHAERLADPPSLFASKERIGSHAIWSEYRLEEEKMFFSDQFTSVLLSVGTSGLDLAYHVREV